MSMGAAIAACALSALSSAGSLGLAAGDFPGTMRPDPTSARPYSRKRVSKYRGHGQTKKLKAGLYKGSRWAKKATRLGGNPARF
jgi:hypothetical protein